jgi:hypothetical protein
MIDNSGQMIVLDYQLLSIHYQLLRPTHNIICILNFNRLLG